MTEQTDLQRLNELHAAATAWDCTLQSEHRFRIAMEHAWPGIYRELAASRKRLATLEEFARRVTAADNDCEPSGIESAVRWLDSETTKAGE